MDREYVDTYIGFTIYKKQNEKQYWGENYRYITPLYETTEGVYTEIRTFLELYNQNVWVNI